MLGRLRLCLLAACLLAVQSSWSDAQIMLSGNENKIDLTQGTQQVIVHPSGPDSLSLVDFSKVPPAVMTIDDVPNTVLGPPSNIAISPDGKLAIVANSIRIDPPGSDKYAPESYAHIVDLTARPPKVVGRVKTGLQPSGASFTPDGKRVLIADRADGKITVLTVDEMKVDLAETVAVAPPSTEVSDVAITPDGKTAFASVTKLGYLAVLKIADGKVTATGQKISAYGQPYRVVVAPDGKLAATAGHGFGTGPDEDCITIVDLTVNPIHAIDYVKIGIAPESFEISPDGNLLAAVLMNGSNKPPRDPLHADFGQLTILKRDRMTYVPSQQIKTGPIPEGVAFTSDGKHLVVQSHPTKKLWVYDVENATVKDSGVRVDLPGMPSSLRASMAH